MARCHSSASPVYSLYLKTFGDIAVTAGQRLSDTLNKSPAFLPPEEAVGETRGALGKPLRAARILLSKALISLVVPASRAAIDEAGLLRRNLRVAKLAQEVHIQTPYFSLRAAIHVVPGAELERYLHQMREDSVPLTGVRVEGVAAVARPPVTPFRADSPC
jgi:hypothetical protein